MESISNSKYKFLSKTSNFCLSKAAYKWTCPSGSVSKGQFSPSPSPVWKSSTLLHHVRQNMKSQITSHNFSKMNYSTNRNANLRVFPGFSELSTIKKTIFPDISNVKKKSTNNGIRIHYDPASHKLVKTIDLKPTQPPIDSKKVTYSNLMVRRDKTISGKSLAKGVVSRYKVVRNTSSVPPNVGQKRPPSTRTTFQSSQYRISKLLKSSANSRNSMPVVIPQRKWSRATLIRPHNITRACHSRYKLVRMVKKQCAGKNLYKIDRRRDNWLKIHQTSRIIRKSAHVLIRRRSSQSFSKQGNVECGGKQQVQRGRDCLFFMRYGKCCRGTACQFVHDPAKVAICTRFLRGTCKVEGCPFSHVVTPDKMPLCRYFLLGKCSRSDCPYLHVKHGNSVKTCSDFERGFCPRGAKCNKKHTLKDHQSTKRVSKGQGITKKDGTTTAQENGKASFFNKFRQRTSQLRHGIPDENSKNQSETRALSDFLPDFIPLEKEIAK